MAQTPIRHVIFWETVIKTRSIYVNCFNTLRFLAEVSTNLQKLHFLDNLRPITQEGSTETRQMTPFFIYFFCSNWLKYSFSYLTMVKFHFLVVPPCSMLTCKIPQFWAKATDPNSHPEVDNLRLLKSILCFVPQGKPKKRYQPVD